MEWFEYGANRVVVNGGEYYYPAPSEGDKGIMVCGRIPELGVTAKSWVECEKHWEPEWRNAAGGLGCYVYDDYIDAKKRIAARRRIRRRLENWEEGDPLNISC